MSVLDVLLTRRPDLGDVELSCANTNTTLPYIDLVNEILEDAVAPPQPVELPPETTALLADGVATHELREALLPLGIELDETAQVYAADSRGERRVRDKSTSYRVINAQSGAGGNSIAIVVSKQTGITAEEARSGPEHISASAYAHLADEVFPFTLPFDLPFETAQIFLDRLGVSQKRILVLFGHEVPEAEHACAALGINATTRKIITDTDGTEAGWKYWGLSEKSNSLPHPDTPTDPQTRITGTWLEVLVRIPVILHRARLSYRELLAVIDTRFINPEKTISIVMPVSDNVLDCDVSAMTITGLDEPAAGRFHRFVRLWRKTNLSIPELDQLLAGRALDDALLAHLSALLDLQQRTDLSFIELVSLFFGLDDHTYRNDEAIQGNEAGRWTAANSLYERIFRTQPVLATASFPRTLAQLTSSATPVGEWTLGLLAALRIKENDLSRILAALGITADTALTPDLLWRLWRVPALARGLDLSVTELLDLTRLTGTDPFASPANAVSFTRAMDETAASPFTFPDLDYLLNHKYAANSGVALESKAIVSFLSTLRVNLTDVLQAVRRQPGEEYSAYVTAQLSQLAAKESSLDLTTALAIINGNWTGTVAEREEHLRRYFTGILTDFDEATTALGELPNNLPPDTQQEKLDERFAYLGVRIESFLTRTTMEGVLRQQLASFFDLAQPSCDLIIDALAAHGHPLLDLLEDPAFLAMMPDGTFASDIDSTTLPLAHETLILAHKAALLVHNFAMMPTDVGWWLAGTHADDLGWIALGDLSVDPRAPIPITRWSAMHWVFSWRAALPPSDLTLLEFFDGVLDPSTTTSQVISSLAHLTGWEEDDVVALVTQFGWLGSGQDTVKAECAQAGQLTRVAECMSGLRQLGVKAGRAAAWATLQPSIPIADEIKRALKARYDEKQWLTVNQSIQDVLREQRRDVLVDWLVAHPDPKAGQTWTNATGLSKHYLIDVETNAVVLTSRLKQATASAAMFVQRILLGLESDILASNAADPQWKQWDWMRRYRVWEANRKVFLYPENWIEPELRDEKSSFFLDLENFLRQQEVTAETAEDAYREYLTKLEKVANLEIRAMHEENIGEESVLHVVGRTRASTGAEYFYRTQVNHARWTPWQPVNLDINADHLNVAVHNNRLYLLWPQFLEKAEEIKRSTNQSQSPKKYWELRMFWSELRGMKWTPKILSNSFIELPFSDTNGSLENVAFRVHLAPQIQVRVFTTPDASKWAPQSDTARSFEKLGPQISPHSDDLMEYLIVPPGARSAENLIRQKGKQLHFYYSNIVRPPHHSLRPNQPIFTIQGRSSGTEEQMVPIKWFVENNPKINSSNGSPRILLFKKMPGRNQIVLDSTAAAFASQGSFFVWDDNRSYFVDYEQWVQNVFTMLSSHSARSFVDVPEFKGSIGIFTSRYKFHPHYHPFVELFTKQLNIFGLPGLLTRQLQIAPETVPGAPPRFEFSSYAPVSTIPTSIGKSTVSLTGPVPGPHPVEEVDFSYTGAYSPYNWELFFHVPMYIAARLAGNQQFEEALAYYNYIFDPTNPVDALHDLDTPQQRFWITKPFYETTREDYYKQRIESIMTAIARGDDEVRAQVAEWRQHPFNPHLIARMRTVAYQKNVLIKYLETLIAWGDQLFAQDTIESINEALQLYMLAASVLGERPRSVPPTAKSSVRTFYQLKAEGIDDFGNALVDIENLLPQTAAPDVTGPQTPSLPRFELRYFGIPNNENLLNLWNTVDDRLFKVRNSLNLEGVFRQLPLFEPPLDPALLVKAAAAGQSITSVLNDLSGPLPAYRFVVMIEKARAATEATMGLGSAILSALEKRDTEKFAALRSTHEQAAMDVQRDVRLSDIEDAKAALDAVQLGKKLVEVRRTYYDKLVNDGLSTWEFVSTVLSGYSLEIDVSIAAGYILSSNLKSIPVFKAGAVGPAPEASTSAGGQNTGDSAEMAVKTLQSLATAFDKGASMANVLGGYQRREQDWQHQAKLAATELPVVDKQIRSAEIKQQITEQNLRYHDKQRENAAAQDEFLHSKFTNDELYDWMLGQLSTAYFQSYQLAYDLAKRAERCFRYELGIKNSSYVGFGYWDTLHKGLLAGEKLSLDLRRLDAAYHDLNQRQYEMTKHFALSQLDPVALMEFKQTGECFFDIPEVAYDLDNPGHYFRRIKSVSLSIPSVVGPYGSVSCTLTLVGNSVRTTPSASGTYSRDTNGEDQRFQDGFASIQSIATSSATDDAGLFQLRFDDERYLPFEGAGAISSWSLRLNPAVPQFDYSSISDVVVHIKYTAREGGEILRTAASENIGKALSEAVLAQDRAGLYRVLDLKRDLPEEFYRFLHPVGESEEQVLSIANLADFLPFFTRAFPKKKVRRVEVVAQFKEAGEARYELVIGTGKDSEPLELAPEAGLYRASKNFTDEKVPFEGWSLKIRKEGAQDFSSLPPDAITELFLVLNYGLG